MMVCCPDCGTEMEETEGALLHFVCPWSCPNCMLCCHDEETVHCEAEEAVRDVWKEREKKTLYIDISWSYCGACGLGAFPEEKTHYTRAGYGYGEGVGEGLGCGVEWEYVSSHYMGVSGLHNRIQEMRPDLEFWI